MDTLISYLIGLGMLFFCLVKFFEALTNREGKVKPALPSVPAIPPPVVEPPVYIPPVERYGAYRPDTIGRIQHPVQIDPGLIADIIVAIQNRQRG